MNYNAPFFSLEEKGQTALGPALLLSVLLAGRVPGSKVHPRACVDTYKIQIVCVCTTNRSSSVQMDWLIEELEVWMVSITVCVSIYGFIPNSFTISSNKMCVCTILSKYILQ